MSMHGQWNAAVSLMPLEELPRQTLTDLVVPEDLDLAGCSITLEELEVHLSVSLIHAQGTRLDWLVAED